MPNEPGVRQPGALLLAQSAECAVWQFRNESGDGTMTVYSVFPGVALNYNDFHMTYFDSGFVSEGGCWRSIIAVRGGWNMRRMKTPWRI